MLKDYVLKEHDYIIETRRYLHSHPELSMKEYETAAFIERELDRFGIAHERVGETGVYGWIDGKSEKGSGRALCVALRADIDALPMQDLKSSCPYRSQHEGICHSCGHDGHTATLLAAAKILKEKEQDFCGRIKLFFQQGEEVCGGARLFVEAGLMDDVDRVYSAHVSPRIESGYISLTLGPVNAACDYFKITVLGKSAHVATPDQGVDALYIASQIVVALQSVISRNTSPLDTVVLGVGKLNCGTAYNIVADKAVLEGTTRTFGTESRERTNRRVREIAEATASMYGASVEIEFENHALAVINDEEAVAEVSEVTKELIPEDHIISNMDKSLSADDVAFYIAKAKGMYAYVGTKNAAKDPNTETPYHNGSFDIDEEALLLSCNIYVDYALRCLNGLEVKAM